ncbi:MAG: GGDEF domain-containing protein [Nevskiaceae bacterium]|nr:MAG: GGDEF domain-containing protein [Nevskiaceae bacterium]
MSQPAPQDLMDTVIAITRKRNCEDFRSCLIETLMALLQTQEIAFLRSLPTPSGDTLLQDLGARREPGGAWHYADGESLRWYAVEDSLQLALRGNRHVEVLDAVSDERVHCIPVIVERRPPELLYFRGGDAGDSRLVLGFAQLYRNFLALISDGERDALTGLLNRKTLETSIRRILESNLRNRARGAAGIRGDRRTSAGDYFLGVIDIDYFKRINDGFGHLYGDEVLLLVAQIMQRSFRAEDLLFRYGGEEFVVVLSPTSKTQALQIFERFRQNIAAHAFPQVGRVTVSTGVVRFDRYALPAGAVGHADQALYYAKAHGRNQVHCYEDLIASGALIRRKRDSAIELF